MSMYMNKTKIEWCDYTWNPITGCSPESEGCKHCYAAAMARRFRRPWGGPVFHPARLSQPAATKRPGRVFCCSTSDIGHGCCRVEWLTQIGEAMNAAPWHQYIVLTKRPNQVRLSQFPSSVWAGVTVEMDRYWTRLSDLRAPWTGQVFVSVEPMLEPVSLPKFFRPPDWVICGPETGAVARPCRDEWIDALERECVTAGIPFFDKRAGDGRRREWPKVTG